MESDTQEKKLIKDASEKCAEIMVLTMKALDLKSHIHSQGILHCQDADYSINIKIDKIK